MSEIAVIEQQLNDFDVQVRSQALQTLMGLVGHNELNLPPLTETANMHCHTFYSFNGYGYSPTALAWQARKYGIKLMGIVDFDTLDAVEEFLNACTLVGVRASAGIETRVYLPQFSSREINSPGEPGVYYHMGIGFSGDRIPANGLTVLAELRQRAEARNRDMIARINAHLAPVVINYDEDVLPFTPAGNATERHILAAYLQAADHMLPEPAPFWAEKLELETEQVALLRQDAPKFQNAVRARLMKQGGVGYVQPGAATFPTVEEFHQLILVCKALPCATWLDGLSTGEQAMEELLALLIDQGVVALNIIPDRNWNIADPDVKQQKLKKLYEVVALAESLDLPLNIGTEMNSYGQKLVDDFAAPELAPVRQPFLDGAYFIYGHTVAQRTLGIGYQSEWAATHLPTRRERNQFYARLGRVVSPGKDTLDTLHRIDRNLSPSQLLGSIVMPA